MKKLFVIVLAAIGMVSCMNTDEVIEVNNDNAIAFADAFIENSVRAEINNDNLDNFEVWGWMQENTVEAPVFNAMKVSHNGADWTYSPAQYWVPGFTYTFKALSSNNATHPNWTATPTTDGKLGEVTFTNVDGTEDLIYAAPAAVAAPALGTTAQPVELEFNHQLAKVKFDFEYAPELVAALELSGLTVEAEEMTMKVPGKATIDYSVDTPAWILDTTAPQTTLEFAKEGVEKLTIPAGAAYEYEITFKVKYYQGANVIKTIDKTSKISLAIEKGKAYNFTATLTPENLGLTTIEFETKVEGWDDANAGFEPETTIAYVDSYEDFVNAIDNGADKVILMDDLVLSSSLTRAADETPSITVNKGKELSINLNGKTLSATSTNNSGNYDMFLVKGLLNVENGTIVTEHKGQNMEWNAMTTIFDITDGGIVNLKDVVAENKGGSDMNFVAHLNNWGEATLNVENSTLKATYIAVRAFNSGYDMNNITINNSTLEGKYCFWVHNYKAAGDSVGTDATLNLDILNGTNTFTYTGKAPILYGFANPIYYNIVNDAEELAAAVENGGAYALSADIETEGGLTNTKDLILDLAGHTISATDNATGSWALITNKANLTVKDSEGNGAMTVEATVNRFWNNYSSVISNTVGGKLVVEGGLIEHLGGTDMAYGIDNLTNGKGTSAETVINGGTIKSTYRAVRMFLNGIEAQNILTVNGGVIEGKNKSIWMQDPSKNANTGKLVVEAAAQLKGDVYLFVCAGSTEWPVEVSLAEAALVGESEVLSGNVPAGYAVVLENGVYTINYSTPVSTADDFTKALSEGGNICLQNDLDITKIDLTNLTNDVVIDANGKTITTSSNYGIQVKAGKNITLKNAKIEMTVAGDYINYAAGFKVENGDYQGNTISLMNCEIRMCNTDWAYAVNMPASVKNLNLVIDGCTLEGALALQCWGDNNTITVTNSDLICNYTTSAQYTSYCVALQGDDSNNADNNTLNISNCDFLYSGVDNFNSTIKAVYNSNKTTNNTIEVTDCTYGEKVLQTY